MASIETTSSVLGWDYLETLRENPKYKWGNVPYNCILFEYPRRICCWRMVFDMSQLIAITIRLLSSPVKIGPIYLCLLVQ